MRRRWIRRASGAPGLNGRRQAVDGGWTARRDRTYRTGGSDPVYFWETNDAVCAFSLSFRTGRRWQTVRSAPTTSGSSEGGVGSKDPLVERAAREPLISPRSRSRSRSTGDPSNRVRSLPRRPVQTRQIRYLRLRRARRQRPQKCQHGVRLGFGEVERLQQARFSGRSGWSFSLRGIICGIPRSYMSTTSCRLKISP